QPGEVVGEQISASGDGTSEHGRPDARPIRVLGGTRALLPDGGDGGVGRDELLVGAVQKVFRDVRQSAERSLPPERAALHVGAMRPQPLGVVGKQPLEEGGAVLFGEPGEEIVADDGSASAMRRRVSASVWPGS